MNFFSELKRRNVIRVGVSYAVVAWVIAQVADLALESFGTPAWVMKTLLFLMAIGFVVALFIAWAYELTPDGIKRARDVDPAQSITHQTGRKLDRLFIVVLLIALATLLIERQFFVDDSPAPATVQDAHVSPAPQAETAEGDSSVAVLPFVNMSSDPEQEYFSDGISEEILNVLTRIPNLKVAARTSSFQFKGQNLDIADIGRQLQVNHVLEGSVRKSGTTLRITAQLIETDSGFHLWSETFDRELEDVFAIQDEIASAIAGELRARLGDTSDLTSKPVNMEAYELYLKGRGLVAKREANNLYQGIEILESCLEVEPGYAPAMATLAKAYVVLPWFSRDIPAGEAREMARQWSTRALEIEPDNTEALAVLGIVYNEVDLNPTGARELLERAVESNPGSVAANNFLGDTCLRSGDFDCALTYELKAAELDPLGPVQLTDMGHTFTLRGEYSRALEMADRALQLDSTFVQAFRLKVDVSYILGDNRQLAGIVEQAKAVPGFPPVEIEDYHLSLLFAQGKAEEGRRELARRAEQARAGQRSAVDIAHLATMVRDFDLAGEMLMQAYSEKDGTWLWPLWVRLPEQAPDSEPWQEFWSQPGVVEVAEVRRSHGFKPDAPYVAGGITW